jgi:hypothetical protein
MCYLLDHLDELPEGMLVGVDFDRGVKLAESRWLERYDAYRVYRLASEAWRTSLKKKREKESFLDWEQGKGDAFSLRALGTDLAYELLLLVLPRISRLTVAEDGFFCASPPSVGWRKTLEARRDFISDPVKWENYAEYVGSIKDLLYFQSYFTSTPFNTAWRHRLDWLAEDEFEVLKKMLEELLDAREAKRSIALSESQADLLRRAIREVGDSQIASLRGKQFRLDSFTPPDKAKS